MLICSEGASDHPDVVPVREIRVSGAVLAGGRSRRMGRDKATILLNGRSAAHRAAEVLWAAGCDPVVQIGGDVSTGLEVIGDDRPGQGPLAAIATAMDAHPETWIVTVACDLVALQPGIVRALIDAASSPEVDVVVARTSRVEPLCSLWKPRPCRGAIDAMLASGERSVHAALDVLRVQEVSVRGDLLLNANTPEVLLGPATFATMISQWSVDEVASRLENGEGLRLVDVRELDEYVAGHVPGARHLPLSELTERVRELDGEGPLAILCQSGSRSLMACEFAASQGIAATNVTGGTRAWIMSGRGVVEGTTPE